MARRASRSVARARSIARWTVSWALGEVAVLQVAIGRLQLQDQPGQSLGQRVVQLLGHALPFLADGQFLDTVGVRLELAMRSFQFLQQVLAPVREPASAG